MKRTHGMGRTRIYHIWHCMKQRCLHSNHPAYKNYGGRGIKICEKWKSFEGFLEWAKNNGYCDTLTIERIDVNGDYCPENCTWIPRNKQNLNKRNNSIIKYNGETVRDAIKRLEGSPNLIHDRIKLGWSLDKAFTTPVLKYKGETERQASKRLGGGHGLVSFRLRKGWSKEKAFTTPVRRKAI